MKIPNLALSTIAAIAVCYCITACGPQEPRKNSRLIRGAGATFPARLYEEWMDRYAAKYPQIVVTYDAVGSGEGVKRFMAGEVDFGASDTALTDEQIANASRGVKLIPMTAGSIALAYHLPGLGGELRLSRELYAGIFMGEVRRWDDAAIQSLNPDLNLPDEEIAVVARRDSSGTTYAFTDHLSAISEVWRDQGPGTGKLVDWPGPTMSATGNDGVARLIKRTSGTIGYLEFGTASRARLAMARLENRAGEFVAPTGPSGMATLANATLPENLRAFFPDPEGRDSYPIVTYTWLLLHGEYETSDKAETIKDFVRWCLTDGQQYNEQLGFIKLPPNVAGSALEAVAAVSSPSSESQVRTNASR